MKDIVFGAGCFWGIENNFANLSGVVKTEVGYAGGTKINPTYQEVCQGDTGHAEVVKVTFDEAIITFTDILAFFFKIHDPTQFNKQGWDIGSQYRSAIFWIDESQKTAAENYKLKLTQENRYQKPIVTQIENLQNYYKAEEYHQKYILKQKS